MENHAALDPSFCLVAKRLAPDITFSREAVNKAYELSLSACRLAVIKVYKGFTYKGPAEDETKELLDSFFGELNDLHPFHYANQIGFDATEPQITKGIAYFIDPVIHGEKGIWRLKAFLRALLGDQPENSTVLDSLESPASYAFQVKAEFPINGKRADIYISWKNNKDLFGVVVEAKFDHHVTPRQLPTYKAYLKKVVKNENNSALVLLTCSGEKAPAPNKGWQPRSWLVVMSKWEQGLKEDREIGFSLLRQFIWNKVRN